MPCRYPANRVGAGPVRAIERVGGRVLETDAVLVASERAETILVGVWAGIARAPPGPLRR